METEALNQLVKQVGDSGGILVLLIPSLLQVLKRIPLLGQLQAKEFPAYEILSIALGIGGAFMLGIPNALVVGIVTGLAAGKGYDWAKGKTPNETLKVPNGS